MASGPIVAMVWHEPDAVKQGRTLFGATNPLASAPGTISGDFTIQTGCNVCRGSNFIDFVNRETAHWFKFDEINNYTNVQIGNKVFIHFVHKVLYTSCSVWSRYVYSYEKPAIFIGHRASESDIAIVGYIRMK